MLTDEELRELLAGTVEGAIASWQLSMAAHWEDGEPHPGQMTDCVSRAVLEALTAANRLIPEGATWGDEYGSLTTNGDVINEFRGPNYATHEREYWIGPWREVQGDPDADEFAPGECTGAHDCDVPVHIHGCFADVGNCDDASDHERHPAMTSNETKENETA